MSASPFRPIATIALCLIAAACHQVPHKAPPRAIDTVTVPPRVSMIAVPVTADLADLGAALEKAVPRALWTIDKPDQVCVPRKRVKTPFGHVKTPEIRCRIVGTVTRGPMATAGAGRDLVVTLPIHATLSARDIGGILREETAEADARVRARIRLDLAPDWSPRATVAIAYDWTDAPHVDFLGQRITFTGKADARLQGVIAKLQRTLPQELAKLHLRDRAADAWASAFTSLRLNESDPVVWMRITPRRLSYGGYRIAQGRLTLTLGMQALTETFVGPRPADPAKTPLPPLARLDRPAGAVAFAIPVIADYGELEPVIARALARRARRPFAVPGIGPVVAQFGRIRMYGTTGGKIALGVTFSAAAAGGSPSHGTIWLTARPANAADSRTVGFADLAVVGVTDSVGADLLIKLANAPGLSATVADALTQDFSRDYAKLLARIATAISEKRAGDLVIRAKVDRVRTGAITATGQGLYLPVSGEGTASISVER